jgi:hypothetical protein
MHCQQRKVATDVHSLVRKFSVSQHHALKRIKMHYEKRQVATEVT